MGAPRKAPTKWEGHGKPLATLDGNKLAPALSAWTRAHQKIAREVLFARWPWPLNYAWADEHCPLFLDAVKYRELDNRKSLSKTQRAARSKCLAWFGEKAAPPAEVGRAKVAEEQSRCLSRAPRFVGCSLRFTNRKPGN